MLSTAQLQALSNCADDCDNPDLIRSAQVMSDWISNEFSEEPVDQIVTFVTKIGAMIQLAFEGYDLSLWRVGACMVLAAHNIHEESKR